MSVRSNFLICFRQFTNLSNKKPQLKILSFDESASDFLKVSDFENFAENPVR